MGNGKGQSMILTRWHGGFVGQPISHRRAHRLLDAWCARPSVGCSGRESIQTRRWRTDMDATKVTLEYTVHQDHLHRMFRPRTGVLPKRCVCGARGTVDHFIYGLPKNPADEASLYCPLPGREAQVHLATKKQGSALYKSGWRRWSVTGRWEAELGGGCFGGECGSGSGEPTYVYHFYDRQGNLLYVGITNDTRRRWDQHATDKPWWHLVARKEKVLYSTREEAEKVEAHQIRTHRPMYNRAMNGWLR